VLSKAFLHQTVILNESFFNAVTAPLFLWIIAMMGIAPVMGWRSARYRNVVRKLTVPWAGGVAVVVLAWCNGYRNSWALLGVGLAAVSAVSMLQEYYRAGRIQRRVHGIGWTRAILRSVLTNRRRYGGYLAHLAFLLVALGVIGSHTNAFARTVILSPGQVISIRGYTVEYQGMGNQTHPGYVTTVAALRVNDGHQVWSATPGLSFFPGSAEPVASVSIHQGWMQDLYMVLEGSPGGDRVLLEIMVNPMVTWIWTGMVVLALGTLLAMSSRTGRDTASTRPSEFDWERPGWSKSPTVVEGRDPQ